MPYNYELDKIGYSELSLSLQNTIKNNLNHTKNDVIHVTQKDKDKWNKITDLPLADKTHKGYISPEEKLKLAGIEKNANRYIHPDSKVTPGLYLQVEVDKKGHVIAGRNPSKINITADNADRLGNFPADSYAKIVSPSFLGTPKVPTPKPDAETSQAVNVEYLNKQFPYVKQKNDPDKKDQNKFWIGPNNCLNAYDDKNKWSSVFAEVGLFLKALNLDETKPTKPDDYSNFFKFTGKRKLSVLGLEKSTTPDKVEYATIFGFRSDEDELAYEFLFIDGDIYIRSGIGDNWNTEKLIISLNRR